MPQAGSAGEKAFPDVMLSAGTGEASVFLIKGDDHVRPAWLPESLVHTALLFAARFLASLLPNPSHNPFMVPR